MRTFAPSKFPGRRAEYKTAKQRRELIGKRVGYDLLHSCMSHYGRITAATRYEISIDGNPVNISSITQIVVLEDQT